VLPDAGEPKARVSTDPPEAGAFRIKAHAGERPAEPPQEGGAVR
jgi:hypothetical protein